MILWLLLALPLTGAVLLSRLRGRAAAAVHAATAAGTLTAAVAAGAAVYRMTSVTALGGLLRADGLSAWLIGLIGLVAALAAIEAPRHVPPGASGVFYPCFHLFVFTMLLAVSTDDVGLMWVAVEGTTLASVFLVNFERTRASLEASYKYLLICSVGIAIAFLGTVLIYFTDVSRFGNDVYALRWTTLIRVAPALSPRVVELGFVFALVGYGTKAGLVPMHTWLPDAHSEAPAPISALMSGVLLAVGLYAILRFKPLVDVVAGPGFARRLFLVLGLASMAVAAAFLWSPRNYKRMLAYSSVEHIGVACLGFGFGGAWGVAGAVLHLANHAFAKSVLFLLAGRIRAAYGSAELSAVRGLLTAMPLTGRSFMLGLLALLGLPPFGLFISEVMIFGAGFQQGYRLVPVIGLVVLVIAFGGLLRGGHRMLYGRSTPAPLAEAAAWIAEAERGSVGWRVGALVPVGTGLVLLLVTGLAWPPGLAAALDHIAGIIGR